jgi:hypothetical protein
LNLGGIAVKKETFFWLTMGLGIGMIISGTFTYHFYVEEKRKKEDPRLEKAEALLEEAEDLLKAARKGRLTKVVS